MNNKKLGNSFEAEFCKILQKNGIWCHRFVPSADGQPSDVIAVSHSKATLIDCKVCSAKGFELRRMEENQSLAMSYWKSKGNGECYFACQSVDNIVMVSHTMVTKYLADEIKSISWEDMLRMCLTLNEWIAIWKQE